ncbi:hypothetical protein SARC_10297 [Sphaeroforma arctica JP610]|uniref:Uncharacterized protein n=1 Tax=Sphaeroforma arctica JP610 TaxID=667725 RepID=A0A0L0FKE8_9EUKA|nr:hypothetical protein SARC_10297 [Sphaeroforma arctica JP610]KNC77235.1 hypothetical protein SARC_10297 [Sphaeroforma arctica JP610]|eukprot:XP_014151137.1 hypothetical protein SARC_10297 [Sphaeroforma arctica JP610]
MYKTALKKETCDYHNNAGRVFVTSHGQATATTCNPTRARSPGMALGGFQSPSKKANKQSYSVGSVGNVNRPQTVAHNFLTYQRMEMGGLTAKNYSTSLTSKKHTTKKQTTKKDTSTQQPAKSPSLKWTRRSLNPFKKEKNYMDLVDSSMASALVLCPTDQKEKPFDTTSQSAMSVLSIYV